MSIPRIKFQGKNPSNVVYALQCNEECSDLYIGETKQPLHKCMSQHRRATTSGQDSAVHLHLKEKGHSFDDHKVRILAREDRWFERGVKEAIHVKLERPSLNRGGGLRHHLSPTYNAVFRALSKRCSHLSHLQSGDPSNSHQRAGGERPPSQANDSH